MTSRQLVLGTLLCLISLGHLPSRSTAAAAAAVRASDSEERDDDVDRARRQTTSASTSCVTGQYLDETSHVCVDCAAICSQSADTAQQCDDKCPGFVAPTGEPTESTSSHAVTVAIAASVVALLLLFVISGVACVFHRDMAHSLRSAMPSARHVNRSQTAGAGDESSRLLSDDRRELPPDYFDTRPDSQC